MRPQLRTFANILALAAMSFLLVPAANAEERSKLDEVLEKGRVVIGTSSEAPPFGFIDDKGELVGFDIDIGRLIGKQLFGEDDRVEFLKQGFAARWANAESGKIDFGIQVTTIHSQRPTKVAFTRAYVDSGIVLVSKKDSGINRIADANSADVTVANLTVPVQEQRWKQLFPKAQVLTFDSTAAQFTAVKTGRAQAAQLDIAQALYYVRTNPEMTITEDWITPPTNNAIFLRKGDFEWWLYLDTIVSEMRSGYLYTEYAKIYEKWFGRRPAHAKHYVEEKLRAAD